MDASKATNLGLTTRGHRISVAIATYNGAKYLSAQLDSIAKQTVQPYELVVSDDHSTDGTRELLLEFAQRSAFAVKVVNNESGLKGVVGNFLYAFDQCTGDYIAYCDQDDVWYPEKLETCLRELANPAVKMVMHRSRVVDGNLVPLGDVVPPRSADQRFVWPTCVERVVGLGHQMVFDTSLVKVMHSIRKNGSGRIPRIEDGFDYLIPMVAGMTGDIVALQAPMLDFRRHASTTSPAYKSKEQLTFLDKLRNHLESLRYFSMESAVVVDIVSDAATFKQYLGVRYPEYLKYVQTIANAYGSRAKIFERKNVIGKLLAFMGCVMTGVYGSRRKGAAGWRYMVKDFAALACGL